MISAWVHSLLFLPEQVPDRVDSAKAFFTPGHSAGAFWKLDDNGAMLWIKAFHIIFVASWFAGLFYLPRIFVNLAQVPADSHAERERLLLMARKLYRFTSLLMIPAVGLGLCLWLSNRAAFTGAWWLHAKLALVVIALGYHHACRSLLRKFERFENQRSERWFRIFNESAVLIFAAIVILVVVKPSF